MTSRFLAPGMIEERYSQSSLLASPSWAGAAMLIPMYSSFMSAMELFLALGLA